MARKRAVVYVPIKENLMRLIQRIARREGILDEREVVTGVAGVRGVRSPRLVVRVKETVAC